AVSGEQVSGHNCLGRARDRVIENKHVNGTWQVMLAVFGIRAVPLHTRVVKATADVGRHRHETTVWAISWHAFMFWIIREINLRTVGVRGCACHAVVRSEEHTSELQSRF